MNKMKTINKEDYDVVNKHASMLSQHMNCAVLNKTISIILLFRSYSCW